MNVVYSANDNYYSAEAQRFTADKDYSKLLLIHSASLYSTYGSTSFIPTITSSNLATTFTNIGHKSEMSNQNGISNGIVTNIVIIENIRQNDIITIPHACFHMTIFILEI